MRILTSELEVLICTSLWLVKNGWSLEAISIARGHGLPPIGWQKKKRIMKREIF